MQRMVDTLDPHSADFFKCLVELKEAIYTYNRADYDRLIAALKDGSLPRDRNPMSDEEIEAIRYSKLWKSRYDCYLRKEFFSESAIKRHLETWIANWNGKEDHKGRPVFTTKTVHATGLQILHIKDVIEAEASEQYSKIAPPKDSRHNLVKYLSNRPESALEKFHELLAHYANSGMRPEYADALTLRGTAEYNLGMRIRFKNNALRLMGRSLPHPRWMDTVPVYTDASMSDLLNRKAAAKNMAIPFPNVKSLKPDNGEQFLYKYLLPQIARNDTQVGDPDDSLCPCADCCFSSADATGTEPRDAILNPTWQNCEGDQEGDGILEEPAATPISPPGFDMMELSVETNNRTDGSAMAELVELPNMDASRCFPVAPYRCEKYCFFVLQQADRGRLGQKLARGRPPHSHSCPKARDWSARQARQPCKDM
jgi:hypothetical protein